MASTSPVDQNTLWNGPGGQIWVAQQAILDGLFQPMADLLVAELPETVTQLLDIGCGTGASLLAAGAARPAARCTGLDISAPMLAMARERAETAGLDADFILADAQRHPLPSAHFDWIQSRLGVMFFEDTGAAFANLHRATRPGAGLRFIAWRSADENPFMTTAERAVGDALELPPRVPGAPGQFAFADGQRVQRLWLPAGRMWRWLRWTFRVRSHAMSCRPTSASWARWARRCGRCPKRRPPGCATRRWQHSHHSSTAIGSAWMLPAG